MLQQTYCESSQRVAEKTRQLLGWSSMESYSSVSYSAAPSPTTSYSSMNESMESNNSYTNPRTRTPASPTNYPYTLMGKACPRKRKNSSSSISSAGSELKHQMTPPPSPRNPSVTITCMPVNRYSSLPVSPVSPNTPYPHPSPAYAHATQDSLVFERLRELVPTLPSDQNSFQMIMQTVTNVVELECQLKDLQQQTIGVRSLLQQQQSHNTSSTNLPHEPVPEDLAHIDVTDFKSLVSPLVVDTSPFQFGNC